MGFALSGIGLLVLFILLEIYRAVRFLKAQSAHGAMRLLLYELVARRSEQQLWALA